MKALLGLCIVAAAVVGGVILLAVGIHQPGILAVIEGNIGGMHRIPVR